MTHTASTTAATETGEAPRSTPGSSPSTASGSTGRLKVVLVTGMSGAGRSTALKALEDIGYEAVNNLPLKLLAALVLESHARPLAVGVDSRTRDFAVRSVAAELDRLTGDPTLDVRLLFLDCDDEVLRRRYTETRRRHPLAPDRRIEDGIRQERRLVTPLRDRAAVVIDTSALSIADLRRLLKAGFALDRKPQLVVLVTSFAYRHGLPQDADLVFDVRFLRNPHYQPDLKDRTGEEEDVQRYIEADPHFATWFRQTTEMLSPLLPRFEEEGKSYLTIAVGCTGGRHRSVHVAERLAQWLAQEGRRCEIRHRDISRPPDGIIQERRS